MIRFQNAILSFGEAAYSATAALKRLNLAMLLHGRRTMNNYLKMHGGVLVRKRAFQKNQKNKRKIKCQCLIDDIDYTRRKQHEQK